jgi:hypothetical protein
MPPLYHRVWQWLKYQVNHDDADIPLSDGTRLYIKRGQHLTSIRNIARGVGWYEGAFWKEPNPKTISKILDWLENSKMVQIDRGRGNRQYTLITLVKYEDYQGSEHGGVTVGGEGREQPVGINNNDKNDKEVIPIIFSHWMSLNLVKHRTLSPQIKNQIAWKLGHFTASELIDCITTYAEILNSDLYILETKWGLHDFFEKGHFEKFLIDRDPYSFYKKKQNGRRNKSKEQMGILEKFYQEGEANEAAGDGPVPGRGQNSLPPL